MNLANKITLFRIALIPLYLVLLMRQNVTAAYIATAVFVLASLSDALDGYIARKHSLVTTFGKFFDPLADKLLVCSALIVLSSMGRFPLLGVILIVLRELTITGFREIAVSRGVIIAADKLGKLKAFAQMVAVIALTLPLGLHQHWLVQALAWFAVAATVVSGGSYVVKNIHVFKD